MIVADTNLLIYLYLVGERTRAAEEVLERDPVWTAPLLWRSEFRNVLALYLRKGVISWATATDAFRSAEQQLHGREYAVETGQVLALVQRSSCSAYDCEFIALAEDLRVRLVTSDTRILGEFPEVAVSMEAFR